MQNAIVNNKKNPQEPKEGVFPTQLLFYAHPINLFVESVYKYKDGTRKIQTLPPAMIHDEELMYITCILLSLSFQQMLINEIDIPFSFILTFPLNT